MLRLEEERQNYHYAHGNERGHGGCSPGDSVLDKVFAHCAFSSERHDAFGIRHGQTVLPFDNPTARRKFSKNIVAQDVHVRQWGNTTSRRAVGGTSEHVEFKRIRHSNVRAHIGFERLQMNVLVIRAGAFSIATSAEHLYK